MRLHSRAASVMNSPKGACQSVTEAAPGGLKWRGRIYLSADSGRQSLRVRFYCYANGGLSRYGRSGCGIRRSVLPNSITRLQGKMNDPGKRFILHPNIWTALEDCSRCAAEAQMLQTSCLVISIFLMRSKAEFQLITGAAPVCRE